MSAQPILRFTLDEFLEREVSSPYRHEYRQGRIEMMAGGTRDHSLIAANTTIGLGQAIAGKDCEVHGPELLIYIEKANTSTYPDVMVICGQPHYYDRRKNMVDNPAVIVEVLSPSTEAYNRGDKFTAYQLISSLREYVLIAQDKPCVERFARGADGKWEREEFTGLSAVLPLESLGVEIELAAIYQRVEWENA